MKIALIGDIHYGYNDLTVNVLKKFFTELQKENFDILVNVGDCINSKQSLFPKFWKMIRKYFPEIPILTVWGNHDFWNSEYTQDIKFEFSKKVPRTYERMRLFQDEATYQYDIWHLPNFPYKLGNFIFYGFDGYYRQIPPIETNDSFYMLRSGREGIPIHQYLNTRSHSQLEDALEHCHKLGGNHNYKKIMVTHMNLMSDKEYDDFINLPEEDRKKSYKYENMAGIRKYLDGICDHNFDYIFWGHNHKEQDFVYRNCRIINPGGGYNSPRYKIIEI